MIKQFAKEAPRTFAITVGWVLFLAGMFVWIVVDDGIWWGLLTAATAVVLGVGFTLLSRWATRGDGLDKPEPETQFVVRIDETDLPLNETQLRAYQAWLQREAGPVTDAGMPGDGAVFSADASEGPPQGDPMPANPDASQGGKP